MWKVVPQIKKEKLSQEILMDCADTVPSEPLLKHVDIQAYNKYNHKGKGFGISAKSQQGDWNVTKLRLCHDLARIEGDKGLGRLLILFKSLSHLHNGH